MAVTELMEFLESKEIEAKTEHLARLVLAGPKARKEKAPFL